MKSDRRRKLALLGEHLPSFPGYTALNLGETDLQLRRVLAERLERVRDRLAVFLAGTDLPVRQADAGHILQSLAALKASFLFQPEEKRRIRELSPAREEQLFDLDLALLERIAALDTLLDQLEASAYSPTVAEALERLQRALEEIDQLFCRRGELLLERREG